MPCSSSGGGDGDGVVGVGGGLGSGLGDENANNLYRIFSYKFVVKFSDPLLIFLNFLQ